MEKIKWRDTMKIEGKNEHNEGEKEKIRQQNVRREKKLSWKSEIIAFAEYADTKAHTHTNTSAILLKSHYIHVCIQRISVH